MDERYPGGESPRENVERIKYAFEKLASAVAEGTVSSRIGVVTHGGVINIIYHIVKGLEWSNRSPMLPIAVASIHRLNYVNGGWMLTVETLQVHLTSKE